MKEAQGPRAGATHVPRDTDLRRGPAAAAPLPLATPAPGSVTLQIEAVLEIISA